MGVPLYVQEIFRRENVASLFWEFRRESLSKPGNVRILYLQTRTLDWQTFFPPSISYLVGNTCVASVNKEGKIFHGRFQGDSDWSPLSPPQELPGPLFIARQFFGGGGGDGVGGRLVFWTDLRGPAQEVTDRQRARAASKQAARLKRYISSAPLVTKLKNCFCCCF